MDIQTKSGIKNHLWGHISYTILVCRRCTTAKTGEEEREDAGLPCQTPWFITIRAKPTLIE
jgi:hypothetical protein